jgi:hypothetical protein
VWREITRRLGRYKSAVLTIVDERGYPLSARCRPAPDNTREALRIDLPEALGLRPGKACLLWHTHDEKLANQWSLLVRGELMRDDEGWYLRPQQVVPGIEQTPWAFYRFVRDCRRKADAYLKARGLARPRIPWDEIEAIKRRALGR